MPMFRFAPWLLAATCVSFAHRDLRAPSHSTPTLPSALSPLHQPPAEIANTRHRLPPTPPGHDSMPMHATSAAQSN